MIRAANYTLAADGKTALLQVQLERDEVHYKALSRDDLLYQLDCIVRLLIETKHRT